MARPDMTARFLRAVADQKAARELMTMELVAAHRAARLAVLDAALAVSPRRKVPTWKYDPDAPFEYVTALGEVCGWAKGLSDERINALAEEAGRPHLVAREDAESDLEDAKRRVAALAPHAVFPKVPEEAVVYRIYAGTYGSQGFGADHYTRQHCRLRAGLLLEARGFEWRIEDQGADYVVIANAPPEISYALRHWWLDEGRLYAGAGGSNLKVLFTGYYPHTLAQDLPVDARQGRDHPDFALMKANEDAHLAV